MKLDHDEVSSDPGNDSIIMRLIVHWVDSPELAVTSSGAPHGCISRDKVGTWRLAFAVQRGKKRRQRHFVDVDPMGTRQDRWPLHRLGAGVWDLSKSVHVAGQFHGFVTLVGVPDPAPWEASARPSVIVAVKDPSPAEIGEFAGQWVAKIAEACKFSGVRGLAVVIDHQQVLALMTATASPDGGKELRAALLKHLQERSQ
jgi:hypothetical protein